MINLHGSDVAELGFELVNPGSAVRHASDCTMKTGSYWISLVSGDPDMLSSGPPPPTLGKCKYTQTAD